MTKPKAVALQFDRRDLFVGAASAALAGFIPRGVHAQGAGPEVTKAVLGYIALTDAAALIIAKEKGLFEKHGMTNIGYWTPVEGQEGAGNTLVYMLAHASVDAQKKSFDAFRADPAWVKARTESEKDGKIVDKVVSVTLQATDFSRMK